MVRENLRLVRLLGEGAMGEVWVAEHLGLQTEVAVKFVLGAVAKDQPVALQRFQREVTAAARITRPHVVQPFDVGVTPDGMPYIVMDLLHGESLAQHLARHGLMPLHDVCEMVAQVARALDRAHESGIIHRDIKPDRQLRGSYARSSRDLRRRPHRAQVGICNLFAYAWSA